MKKDFYLFSFLVVFVIFTTCMILNFIYRFDKNEQILIISDICSYEDGFYDNITEKIEILEFSPNLKFIEVGDSNYIVDVFAQFFQKSTNFLNHTFILNNENSSIEKLVIHFENYENEEFLKIPCVLNGTDFSWDPFCGGRIVKFHASFFLTEEKRKILHTFMKDTVKCYFTDNKNILLNNYGENISYILTEKNFSELSNVF